MNDVVNGFRHVLSGGWKAGAFFMGAKLFKNVYGAMWNRAKRLFLQPQEMKIMRLHLKYFHLASVLLLLVCGTLSAQSLIVMQGTVSDVRTGKPIQGANVAEQDPGGRTLRDIRTDANGQYFIRITSGNTLVFSTVVDKQEHAGLTESATLDVSLRRTQDVQRVKGESYHADKVSFFAVPLFGMQVNRGGGFLTASEAGDTETVLATGAMLPVSYGGMLGVVKTAGGYVKYRQAETKKEWVQLSSPEIRAGVVYHMEENFFLYLGGGVDKLKQTVSGETMKKTWPAVETGIICRWGVLGLSAGFSYVFSNDYFFGNGASNDFGFDFGIGIVL